MQERASERPVLAFHCRWDGDPAADLAAEQALLARVAAGGPATLFAYGWTRPVAVLGRGQDAATLDVAAAARLGVPIVRRASGGTAVVHQGDLALSLVLPDAHPWARPIAGLYARFLDALSDGLVASGLPRPERPPAPPRAASPAPRSPICFEGNAGDTLAIGGRKAVGCAQARRRGAVLVHGMLLLGLDAALQAAVFGVPPARILAAMAPLPGDVPRDVLARRLANALAAALGLEPAFAPLPDIPDPART